MRAAVAWSYGPGLAGAVLLAGCVEHRGPVFGEWTGDPPGGTISRHQNVDLVLYGAPDAQSGHYHITSTMDNPEVRSGHGEDQWGGTWKWGRRNVDGHEVTTITLEDHLPDEIGGYVLEADGTLHILDPNGLPDTTPGGALYTLSPVR